MRKYTVLLAATIMLSTAPLAEASASTVTVVSISRTGQSYVTTWSRVNPSVILQETQRLRSLPGVLAAGVPGMRKALGGPDPRRVEQWALDRLEAGSTLPLSKGTGVIVAILDTGVDANHEDLKGRVLPGADFISPGGDANRDPNGHGTHVAGIVAAVTGNGVGVESLTPDVRILPVRVLDETGYGDDSVVAKGILWALDNGAQVISMSLGGPDKDPLLADAVSQAKARGVPVIVAAGNEGLNGNIVSYPGANPDAVAVAATSPGDMHAMFSTSADYVDIAAPGSNILSTFPGNQYAYESGTSMATPFVASVVAATMSKFQMSGLDAVKRVLGSATDLGASGKDPDFGEGLVDPYAALTDGKRREAPPLTLPTPGTPTIPGLPPLPDPGDLPNLPSPTLPVPTLPSPVASDPSSPSPVPPGTAPALPLPKLPKIPGFPALDPATPVTTPNAPSGRKTADMVLTKPKLRTVSVRLSHLGKPLPNRKIQVFDGKNSRWVVLNSKGQAHFKVDAKRSVLVILVSFPGDGMYAPVTASIWM